jgi:hypothetical protein
VNQISELLDVDRENRDDLPLLQPARELAWPERCTRDASDDFRDRAGSQYW